MKRFANQFSVQMMCRVFQVSSSGYYAWLNRKVSAQASRRRIIDNSITKLFLVHKGRYGSPRLTSELNDAGIECSENTVAKRMNALGLQAKASRKFRARRDKTKR